MSSKPYLRALSEIPRGETRSFAELAAIAGRPGAARAAGRALASLSRRSPLVWHRVVPADGAPRDAALQLRRLRKEGARPTARESIRSWAERVGAPFVGLYGKRVLAASDDSMLTRWHGLRVEPFGDQASAAARGFLPPGVPRSKALLLPTATGISAGRAYKTSLNERLDALGWTRIHERLAREGAVRLASLLSPRECSDIRRDSITEARFERSVDMFGKGYGVGSYHFYREPLPKPAHALRQALYPRLAPAGAPESLAAFWRQCRSRGQRRPSSILIGYPEGGVNHPHRDIYGPIHFPYQALVLLSRRGRDFEGGEFYVADDTEEGEQRRRAFSASEGDVVIFATRQRRAGGSVIPLRHGMTRVSTGVRFGLGIVFHLAE